MDANQLEHLLVYRRILQDDLMQQLLAFLRQGGSEADRFDLAGKFIERAEALGLEGNIIKSYFIYLISRDENAFSAGAEKYRGVGPGLYEAVLHDIRLLYDFLRSDFDAALNFDILKRYSPTVTGSKPGLAALQAYLLNPDAQHTPEEIADRLVQYYVSYGFGNMADYVVFRWDSVQGLYGIKPHDEIRLDDIIGYERQKHLLVKNTEAFLARRPANNVLLAGARGTGKSSSVKALVNHYGAAGLRLVEVPKDALKDLPEVLNVLRSMGKRFIVFLDDLSFEESETDYKSIKSVLEGGVSSRAENVLIYATSNRRHLIRETWSDRSGSGADIYGFETVNEKISLSDRFGLTLTYEAPSQEEYFRIVEAMAKKYNIKFDPSRLRAEARKWEMTHSGLSGRIAKQFISYLQSVQCD